MKIAFFIEKFVTVKGGGAERSLAELMNEMHRRGHEITRILRERRQRRISRRSTPSIREFGSGTCRPGLRPVVAFGVWGRKLLPPRYARSLQRCGDPGASGWAADIFSP